MQYGMTKRRPLWWVPWSIGHGRKICRTAYRCASLLSSLGFEPQFVNLFRSPGIYVYKFGLWVQLIVQRMSEFWEYMLSRVDKKDCTVYIVQCTVFYGITKNICWGNRVIYKKTLSLKTEGNRATKSNILYPLSYVLTFLSSPLSYTLYMFFLRVCT
jgi:hypothetical protein